MERVDSAAIPAVQTAQALVRLYGRLKGEVSKASAGEDVLIPVGDGQPLWRLKFRVDRETGYASF